MRKLVIEELPWHIQTGKMRPCAWRQRPWGNPAQTTLERAVRKHKPTREDALLKLKDEADTRTDGYTLVFNNLWQGTARLQIAVRFENRVVGAKPNNCGKRLDESKEGVVQSGVCNSQGHQVATHKASANAVLRWAGSRPCKGTRQHLPCG